MHPLVRFWAQKRADTDSQRAKASEAINLMANVLVKDYRNTLFDNPIIKHFDASLYSVRGGGFEGAKINTKDHQSTFETFHNIGLLLRTHKRYDEAIE